MCNAVLKGTWWVCQDCLINYNSPTAASRADCPSTRALAAPPSALVKEVPRPDVGKVSKSPDGQRLILELTPEEVAEVANRIVMAMAAAGDIDQTTQTWISALMLATANLQGMGVPHHEVMQLVTIAWNGAETGMFVLRGAGEDRAQDEGGDPGMSREG